MQQQMEESAKTTSESGPMAPAPSLFSRESEMPQVSFSFKQRILKGEDMALAATPVRLPGRDKLEFQVFAVFDGHSGDKTAKFCKKHLVKELLPRLPDAEMPSEDDKAAFEAYLEKLREALLDTFLALNRKSIAADCCSECTATVLVVTGWLATIANVGDSALMMHSASGTQQLTADHRLDNNAEECRRLEEKGYLVARLREDLTGPVTSGNRDEGYGPLRAWPGSLMMTRAIGDSDAGIAVMPYPHIAQIKVPETGARFIAASDGLWDSNLSLRSVIGLARRKSLDKLASRIVRDVVKTSGLLDDTTVMCIDVVPSSMPDVRESFSVSPDASRRRGSASAFCFGCGAGSADQDNRDDPSIHHFSKIHMDQLVEAQELEGLNGSFTSLTRIRSISQTSSVPPGLNAGPSANLECMPSIDGLSIMRSSPVREKSASFVRVLSCLDTSSSVCFHPSISEEMEDAAEDRQDASPSKKGDIEDHNGVVVSVEQSVVNKGMQ